MLLGKIVFSEDSSLKRQMDEKMERSPYILLKQEDKCLNDLVVCGTNLGETAAREMLEAFVASEGKGYESYANIYHMVECKCKAAFIAFYYKKIYKAVMVCCDGSELNERMIYHEKGHAEQCQKIGFESFDKLMKSKEKELPYLEVHNIIFNENAPGILEKKYPKVIRYDYETVSGCKKTIYIRTKYCRKPADIKSAEEIENIEKTLETLCGKKEVKLEEKEWFEQIQGGINRICEEVAGVTNEDKEKYIKVQLLTLCSDMVKKGYDIFKENNG